MVSEKLIIGNDKFNWRLAIENKIIYFEEKIKELQEAKIDLDVVNDITDMREFVDKWRGKIEYFETPIGVIAKTEEAAEKCCIDGGSE